MPLDGTDPQEILVDGEGRQRQIYGGQLFDHTHGIAIAKP